MTLIDGVDAAYPPLEGSLPASTRFVAGYAGLSGATPNIWTVADIEAVRKAGRVFLPIVVPYQRPLTPADGALCASVMLAYCQLINHPKNLPVLIDIEHAWYVANPSGAMAAVQAFERAMAASGYQRGIPYLPFAANQGWVAHWDNTRPQTLPAGWVGDQYGGVPGYDLDVFDSALFGPTPVLPTGQPDEDDMQLTDTFMNPEQNHIESVEQALINGSNAYNICVNLEGQMKQVLAHLNLPTPAPIAHTLDAPGSAPESPEPTPEPDQPATTTTD